MTEDILYCSFDFRFLPDPWGESDSKVDPPAATGVEPTLRKAAARVGLPFGVDVAEDEPLARRKAIVFGGSDDGGAGAEGDERCSVSRHAQWNNRRGRDTHNQACP